MTSNIYQVLYTDLTRRLREYKSYLEKQLKEKKGIAYTDALLTLERVIQDHKKWSDYSQEIRRKKEEMNGA